MAFLLGDDLSPYTDTWGKAQSAHLLRRTLFGPTFEQIKEVEQLGLEAAVDLLLSDRELPEPPLNYKHREDPRVGIGETWVNIRYPEDGTGVFDRRHSMDAWILGQLLNQGLSVREKMTLFWHNHFPVERDIVGEAKYLYNYSNLLRENALGNFKQLVKDISIDPAMLYYLNGRDNTKDSPNENYARELLELFTIGKGDIAGPGDYTTYTEDDVVEIARILTGWQDFGRFSTEVDAVYSEFFAERHDEGLKRLSHRFEGAEIPAAGEEEYKNLIDLVFQQKEVAAFISRKLYRWFVNFDISPAIENSIIQGMAQILIDHDFEIKPVLSALLKSKHFNDASVCGAIIKNPLDFVFSVLNSFEVAVPENLINWYINFRGMTNFMNLMQMSYFYPPSVAGWEAYYLEPQYYKKWINSATLRPRLEFTDKLAQEGFKFSNFPLQIDVLSFISSLDNPSDIDDLIRDISLLLFPKPLPPSQVEILKDILIPGLPDFEWTLEYGLYLEDITDEELALPIEKRLRDMIQTLLSFPQFHTS